MPANNAATTAIQACSVVAVINPPPYGYQTHCAECAMRLYSGQFAN